MKERPVIHGRDHEYGGADPARFAWEFVGNGDGETGPGLPRARLWSDNVMPQLTLAPGDGDVFPFNHSTTNDPDTFLVGASPEFPSDPVRYIFIVRGGTYVCHYQLAVTSKTPSGGWEDTPLWVTHYEPAWDGWDGWHRKHPTLDFPVFDSYEFTVRNDVMAAWGSFGGQPQYLNVHNPAANASTYVFGNPASTNPTGYMGCELEIVRIGDATTDDLTDDPAASGRDAIIERREQRRARR